MTEAEYRTAVRGALSAATGLLQEALAARLRILPSQSDAAFIEFIVHPSDFPTCPIYAFETSLDSCSSAWGGRDKIQILESHKLLPPELDYCSSSWAEDIAEPDEIVMHEIACWFAGAWKLAGGLDYCLPGFIAEIDDLKFFSLRQQLWMAFPTDPRTGCFLSERLI